MINCCRNNDECNCECHINDNIIHCAPCCYRCPYCLVNIRIYFHDEHIIKCKGNYNEKNAINR